MWANNTLTFEDLISLSVHLLRTELDLADKLRKRYKHILVDEFQVSAAGVLAAPHRMLPVPWNVLGDVSKAVARHSS